MLSTCLVDTLDRYLENQGFRRRRNSLHYSRRVAHGSQLLLLFFDVGPRYAPGALAHLLPQARLILPHLNQAVQEMVAEAPDLIATTEFTFSEQLHNAAPHHVGTGEATRWFVYDLDSARECIVSMRRFLEQWTIPFLNRYTSVASLIEGYEQKDECLPQDRRFLLFVTAAYLVIGRPERAMQVLEDKLGRPGARRQYAKVFEYVSAWRDR